MGICLTQVTTTGCARRKGRTPICCVYLSEADTHLGRFFRDADVRNHFLPLLYQQFDANPSARPAFFRLNEDLLPTIRSGSKIVPKLKEFRRPVRIVFGANDPYLNKGVAQRFHELFPASDLFLLPSARHFVQMDEPEEVARLILSTPVS